MAKTAAQLAAEAYEKQKRQNRYGTTSGGAVTKTNPVDASKQAAQIYQQQKNSGIYKTTSGGTVKSPIRSGGSSGGARTIPSVTIPAIKTPNIPTKKYNPVRPTPNKDVSSIDQSQIVADAYKQKMAQYRQSIGNDDEETNKYKKPSDYNGYGKWMLPTVQNGNDITINTLKPATAPAPAAPAAPVAYEQPVVEEMLPEEELDPMEDYWQAIIDKQNALYAAMNQALRNQQSGLNSLYDQNAADLYAQYVRSGLILPEQMAGMATGTADSMMLQNDLNYQNNLNKNELERIAGLADIDAQMAQNQADADLQAAQTAAEWAQMAYQQRLAEQEADRKYKLALAKANQRNSNNKPVLDATKALAAWKEGYDSPQIRESLMYYYGYLPDRKNETTKPSGANSVSSTSANLGAGIAAGTNNGVTSSYGIVDTNAYYVPGLGRLSGAEVKKGIQSGQIDVYKQGSEYFFRKA